MFIQVWNKYLPIIKILLKRAATSDQTLDMNRTDFEKAAGGRKARYTFNILFTKGRVDNLNSYPPVARELATVLLEDTVTRNLFRAHDYQMSMNTSFQLSIKRTPTSKPELTTEEVSATAESEEAEQEEPPEKDDSSTTSPSSAVESPESGS